MFLVRGPQGRFLGELEGTRKAAAIFQLIYDVTDLLTHIADMRQQLCTCFTFHGILLWLLWLLGHICVFRFVMKDPGFCKTPSSPNQRQQEQKRCQFILWESSLFLNVSTYLDLLQFTSIFPKWLHALWISSSSIRCRNNRLAETSYPAPMIPWLYMATSL